MPRESRRRAALVFTGAIYKKGAERAATQGRPCAPALLALRGGRGVLLHRLQVDRDLDLVAQHRAAGVERLVPDDPVVLAVERGLDLEAGPGISLGILDLAAVGHRQGDLLADAVHGQRARDVVLVLAGGLDRLALEGDLGILLDVEEIGRA